MAAYLLHTLYYPSPQPSYAPSSLSSSPFTSIFHNFPPPLFLPPSLYPTSPLTPQPSFPPPPPPTAIVCPILYPPTNGNFSLSDRRCYRSEATYSCDVGYILYGGDMIRTCQENMQWSGREPCCIRESSELSVCYIIILHLKVRCM